MEVKSAIEKTIVDAVAAFGRSDLYRCPIVSFSNAQDQRYAQLKDIVGDWMMLPTAIMPTAKSVICYFIPFTQKVVKEPTEGLSNTFLWAESYEESQKLFDTINAQVGILLADSGFEVMAIPGTGTYSQQELKSGWSHRSAAAIAGLGTFGANRLLITQKGSGGRFCSLLTSARLTANKVPPKNKCFYIQDSSCGLCHKICPGKAFAGNGFDKFRCNSVLLENQKTNKENGGFDSDVCGKCISVCPMGYIE